MKIGIIGAGEVGGTLCRQYTRVGHKIKITNGSGPHKLRSLCEETGASAVTLSDAVVDVDVVVVSIPFFQVAALPKALFKSIPAGTPIIDTCNYYPIVSGKIQDIIDGIPESVWVANQLERPVIKAYNTILYRSLRDSPRPKGELGRIALPVAGDDKKSKEIVSTLINDSGFDSLDYGSLQDSWRQQPGSPAYCTDLTLAQLKRSILKAEKGLLADRRELGLQYILNNDRNEWKDNVIFNRGLYESDLTT